MANVKIREKIHHGNYRHERVVEVYALNAVTVDAVVQSSAYCYGSLSEGPQKARLDALVADLKAGKVAQLGWSDFEVIH